GAAGFVAEGLQDEPRAVGGRVGVPFTVLGVADGPGLGVRRADVDLHPLVLLHVVQGGPLALRLDGRPRLRLGAMDLPGLVVGLRVVRTRLRGRLPHRGDSSRRASSYPRCNRSAVCCIQRSSVSPARAITMPRVNASHGFSVPPRSPSHVADVASTFGPLPFGSAASAKSLPSPAWNSIARAPSVIRSSARPSGAPRSAASTAGVA